MMRDLLILTLGAGMLVGCESNSAPQQGPAPAVAPTDPPPGGGAPIGVTAPAAESAAATTPAAGAAAVPVSKDGVATLTPDNTRLEFVGSHVGPTPDPNARTGTFTDFTGELRVDPASKAVTSISMDIQTASLNAGMQKLTDHLMNQDFLDAREHPSLTFASTAIGPGASDGEIEITGDLTMHGVTRPVTIPAKAHVDDSGVSLNAKFTIDRTEFGMDQLVDKVEKVVTLTVVVGEKNVAPTAPAQP